jgi:hypothetical protein
MLMAPARLAPHLPKLSPSAQALQIEEDDINLATAQTRPESPRIRARSDPVTPTEKVRL